MKKKLMIALCATLVTLPLAGCYEDGYGGVAMGYGSPYAYNGFYDDYYGPVYDGYWGTDGGFYYRNSDHDRGYRRGDPRHFSQSAPSGQGNWHPIQGSMTPQRGMHMPHFGGNGGGRHH